MPTVYINTEHLSCKEIVPYSVVFYKVRIGWLGKYFLFFELLYSWAIFSL